MGVEVLQVKIPELEALPPERRETVLRGCLESEEFAHRIRKIRRICFVSAVAAAITLINVFVWSRITGNRAWLLGVLVAGTAVFCIVLMLFSQAWFEVRLVRRLVRREVHDETSGGVAP